MDKLILEKIRAYFTRRDDVVLAYLFGSWATGTGSPSRSDCDIAIYFKPKTGELEYETEVEYDAENEIQEQLEKLTGSEIDLIVLNRAPAHQIVSIIKTGTVLKESNRKIFLDLWLRALDDAEDYRIFAADYLKIMERSRSLSPEDKTKLVTIITFLRAELELHKEYGSIDQLTYMQVDMKRKALERNIENIANAALDIAKILLASRKNRISATYSELMLSLVQIKLFDHTVAAGLAQSVRLRNFLAHEYLDLRYKKIRKFSDRAEHDFGYLITFTEKILAAE